MAETIEEFLKRTRKGGITSAQPDGAEPKPSAGSSAAGSNSAAPTGGGETLEQFAARTGAKPPAVAQPQQDAQAPTAPEGSDPGARGYARNVAAGAIEGSTGALSMLADPSGSLLQLPVRVLGTGYDALARGTGWFPPMSDQLRRDLYGQTPDVTETQMTPRAVNALGGAIQQVLPGGSDKPVMPADVQPATPGQARTRAAVAGAVGGLPFGMPVRGAVAGGGGEVAKEYVPEWAQPGVDAVTNALVFGSKGAGEGAADAVRTGIRYTGNALERVTQPATTALERALTYGKGGPEEEAAFAGTDRGRVMARVREIAEEGGARGGEPGAPAGGGPSPGMGGPQPAGAQVTPAGAAAMTPEEVAAHRYTADKQWLMKSKPPGEADTTEYVPGINPTAAQQEQTAVRAREMKTVRNLSPEVAQSERELLSHHNDKRKDFYAETAGSEVTRQADMTAAEQKIEADLKTVWQNKGEADAHPIIGAANAELDGSAGLLPPVRDVVKQVTDAVTNADGSLKTDPQQLYQARRLINYMQSKAGRAQNPGYGSADVQASLVRMKDAVDQVIEPAAHGFSKAISDYAQARGPIDAAETLQARENGLLDSQGRMQYSRVHNLLRDVIEAQKPGAPASPLSHVSEAQLARLKSLHDDLQRVASAEDLARASGSDSVQNAADAVKALAKMGARGAAHAVANTVAPGIGSLAVEGALQGASRVWEPFRAARAERGLRRRGQELLYPPEPKGGRTPNPLRPPD